ncbi:hypothetical protein EXS71_04225 [Candidatus Uhrbacteria bacterium]|nr:hypothetical protein [Candidatus Uhrbacteria bacterium]
MKKLWGLAVACLILLPAFFSFAAVQDEQASLQQQLKDIETQIVQYQTELKVIGGRKNTLQNKIDALKKQQATLVLQIKAASLQVARVNEQLVVTKASLQKNTTKLGELQDHLAQLIQILESADHQSPILMLFSDHTLSDFFAEQQAYENIISELGVITSSTHQIQHQLSQQQVQLADEQEEATHHLSIQQEAQQKLLNSLGQQKTLLQETKGQESAYQSQLADAAKQAATIRGRLYDLLGTAKKITFGDAAKIAQSISVQTGVRAAFLLAVLTQESNLGRNVGTCNRASDPPEKHWRAIMKPERDHAPFETITNELGLDIDTTAVSCPMRDKNGKQLGWGGAMGPAQFIPSTWMGYKARVAAFSGKTTANPWDIRDAFIAAALKLKADGAGSESGEWAAAMRYFSGGTNPAYRFYGDNVIATATQYQKDLDQIK